MYSDSPLNCEYEGSRCLGKRINSLRFKTQKAKTSYEGVLL
jgi:hypothetical protein